MKWKTLVAGELIEVCCNYFLRNFDAIRFPQPIIDTLKCDRVLTRKTFTTHNALLSLTHTQCFINKSLRLCGARRFRMSSRAINQPLFSFCSLFHSQPAGAVISFIKILQIYDFHRLSLSPCLSHPKRFLSQPGRSWMYRRGWTV